eukprot:184564-Chlamydomonas_euryale.AAC.3
MEGADAGTERARGRGARSSHLPNSPPLATDAQPLTRAAVFRQPRAQIHQMHRNRTGLPQYFRRKLAAGALSRG